MSRAASCVQPFAFNHMQLQQAGAAMSQGGVTLGAVCIQSQATTASRGWVLGHGQEAVGEGSDGTGGEVGANFFFGARPPGGFGGVLA